MKREEKAIKRWTRLIHGLRIRQRLQEQYAGRGEEDKATEKEKEDEEVCMDSEHLQIRTDP